MTARRSTAATASAPRSMGLLSATMVGVSAMVGAGILVLCGVAIRSTGPSAIVAFAANGLIATVTAFSFAELAAAFPESGGGYVFAKKVLPIGGAFTAGWVLHFAYVVTAALYALAFAGFGAQALALWHLELPWWGTVALAPGIVALTALIIEWRGTDSGTLWSILKVVGLVVIIGIGFGAWLSGPKPSVPALTPLYPYGTLGVVSAMGFTFIALQGFEVITTVSNEVRNPTRTIPLAMFLSIGITISLYVGLLVVVLVAGGEVGATTAPWLELGRHGENAVRVAATRFGGSLGNNLVIGVGILATFTALSAALIGASRTAYAMGCDRTLPRILSRVRNNQTPTVAMGLSVVLTVVLVFVLSDIEIAGAAASLMFLLAFALTNASGMLVRVRVGVVAGFRSPLFPALPLFGITSCLGLALFQAIAVPLAAALTGAWLVLGGTLYAVYFRRSALAVSARSEAQDSALSKLRGRSPLVLVPLANPERAAALMSMAQALIPHETGRVLVLSVIKATSGDTAAATTAFDEACIGLRHAVASCSSLHQPFTAMLRLSKEPVVTIAKVANEQRPQTLLVGMSHLSSGQGSRFLDTLIAATRSDLAILQAPPEWALDERVEHVLVPVASSAGNDAQRSRIVGVLLRKGIRRITLLRFIDTEGERSRATVSLQAEASDLGLPASSCVVEHTTSPLASLLAHAEQADLLVLGLGRSQGRRALISPFVRKVAAGTTCPLLAVAGSSQGKSS